MVKVITGEFPISEFTDIVRSEIGLREPLASALAAAIVRGLCSQHGGSTLYTTAKDKCARNSAIRAESNRINSAEVC